MNLSGAVGGDNHYRRYRGADNSYLGNGHLEVGEYLQQESLELLVGPVKFIDQQHRGSSFRGRELDRLEKRARQQILAAHDALHRSPVFSPTRFYEANRQHLASVVPLVQGVIGVETLVALQPDKLGLQYLGQHLGYFRFSHTCLPLQKQGAGKAAGEVNGDRQGPIGQIPVIGEGGGHFINGTGDHGSANST